MTTEQIKNCTYHPVNNPFCPIFRVGDVLSYTGQKVDDLADKVFLLFGHFLLSTTHNQIDIEPQSGLLLIFWLREEK